MSRENAPHAPPAAAVLTPETVSNRSFRPLGAFCRHLFLLALRPDTSSSIKNRHNIKLRIVTLHDHHTKEKTIPPRRPRHALRYISDALAQPVSRIPQPVSCTR